MTSNARPVRGDFSRHAEWLVPASRDIVRIEPSPSLQGFYRPIALGGSAVTTSQRAGHRRICLTRPRWARGSLNPRGPPNSCASRLPLGSRGAGVRGPPTGLHELRPPLAGPPRPGPRAARAWQDWRRPAAYSMSRPGCPRPRRCRGLPPGLTSGASAACRWRLPSLRPDWPDGGAPPQDAPPEPAVPQVVVSRRCRSWGLGLRPPPSAGGVGRRGGEGGPRRPRAGRWRPGVPEPSARGAPGRVGFPPDGLGVEGVLGRGVGAPRRGKGMGSCFLLVDLEPLRGKQ